MLHKVFALSAVAVAALAQDSSHPDILTLFNETRGFGYLNEFLNAYPPLRQAIGGLTNVTILAPSNAALRLFPWDPRWPEVEDGTPEYIQSLIAYHIIEGIHENFTDSWLPYQTSLRPGAYANVTGGQVVIGRWNWRGWETEVQSGMDLLAHAPTMLRFDNGIIYPIDDLLNIPGNITKELTTGSINGTTFVELLERAGLKEEVEGLSDVTLLVPDDAAFEAVGQSISELSTEELAEVLRYHIIPDTVAYAHLIENGTSFTTLQGSEVAIYENEEEHFIQNAVVSDNNVLLSNGVAIVLDHVLSPGATVTPPTAEQVEGVPAFPTGAATPTGEAASTTTATAPATFTGAATSFKQGAVSLAALAAAIAFAMNL